MKQMITIVLFLIIGGTGFTQSPDQIISRMEENQSFSSARFEGRFIIEDRWGTKETEFTAYTNGEENTRIDFTSGEERGQKILRTENEIYLYYPDAEEVIRLQGAALRESVMGSDLSYEDIAGDRDLTDEYEITLEGTEQIDGHECYHLRLEANTQQVPYPIQEIWVDTELYVMRKAEYYSLNNRLLKTMEVLEISQQSGYVFPTHYTMVDHMKRNSSTEFIIESIDLNARFDRGTFSLEDLSW
ncbi:MAG: outer membrane lipoprotein-sorting protein [Spirochaetia bacterium]